MIVLAEPDFQALPEATAALFAAAGADSFFAQAAWYDLMARHVRDPGDAVRLYLDADPPGAAFICRLGRGARQLQGFANFYSLEHGPILEPGSSEGAQRIARLMLAIVSERPAWQSVGLAALDPDDPAFAAILAGLGEAHFIIQPYFHFGTWYEDTRGLDFRRYLDDRPAALRNTYRRKSGAARRLGAEYEFSEPGCDLERLIVDYETVYDRSWKNGEPYPRFIPALMRMAFAAGALRLGVVRIDHVPAAAQFWIVWRARAVIYKLAHDRRFDALSPGTLLTMRMAERVLDGDRPDEINFGRGDDPYKRLWLPKRRERWGILAANPRTWRGAATGLRLRVAALARRLIGRRYSGAAGLPAPRPRK